MEKRPFEMVVFNSNVERHVMPDGEGRERYVDFVLDLESARFPRNPCVVDYDHDTKEPIGSATLSVEDGQIVARGFFVSAVDGDRAYRIATTCNDVPYGVSPTLDLNRAEPVVVCEGATGFANGRSYEGPVVIYRGAEVLGVSVCPIPTDCKTSVSALEKDGVVKLSRLGAFIMPTETMEEQEPIPVDEKTVETLGDDSGVQDAETPVRDKELQEFCDEFGLEKGVAFYQRNLTIDEARLEDYQELKRLSKLNACETKKEELSDCASKEEEEAEGNAVARLSRDVKKSLAILNGLCVKLARLEPPKGAASAPSATFRKDVKPTYADSVKRAVR